MRERRQAWDRHRQKVTQLILAKTDWIPVLLLASFLATPEARIDFGGFQLYPYRLALIASIPFMIMRVGREPVRFGPADFFVLASTVWMFIATTTHYELSVALKTGGAQTLDISLAYLAGRIFFRTALDLRRFLYRISPLILAIALLMVAESVSHRYLMRPFVSSITGFPALGLNRIYELRMGLLRATGPFLHPIAGGLFLGSFAPLFLTADLPRRRWIGLAGCFGAVFGWSSTGLVSLGAGVMLALYDQPQKHLRLGWMPLIWAVIAGMLVIELLSDAGVAKIIIRYAALNPATGYFRLAIWDFGWADVGRHPWFGIGLFESYERPPWMKSDSVDNHWLLIALRYGIPCTTLLFVGVMLTVISLGSAKPSGEPGALYGKRMTIGVTISIVVSYFSLLTSAPWGADLAWLIMLLGIGNGLKDAPRLARARQSRTL